ncbi:MAG TPA: hypothetical protein VGA69_03320 [Nitriliruptorales bacterium]
MGTVAAAVIALAAWGRPDATRVSVASVVAVGATTVLFGVIVGLVVGQFIRMAGIVGAWKPRVPTILDTPAPSANGHGSPEGNRAPPVRNGAAFAVASTITAILAAMGAIPMFPAPIVLGVGALAVDERSWVRVTASAGLFVAAFSLAVFLVSNALEGSAAAGPVLLAAVVATGIGEFALVRRVRPSR